MRIFSYLLLECKVILITEKPKDDMANLTECLLSLLEPINTEFFARLTYIYSEPMCEML